MDLFAWVPGSACHMCVCSCNQILDFLLSLHKWQTFPVQRLSKNVVSCRYASGLTNGSCALEAKTGAFFWFIMSCAKQLSNAMNTPKSPRRCKTAVQIATAKFVAEDLLPVKALIPSSMLDSVTEIFFVVKRQICWPAAADPTLQLDLFSSFSFEIKKEKQSQRSPPSTPVLARKTMKRSRSCLKGMPFEQAIFL